MDSRILQISFNRAGSESITKRVTLSSSIVKDMKITEDERQIELIYDKNKKEIKKHPKKKAFINYL